MPLYIYRGRNEEGVQAPFSYMHENQGLIQILTQLYVFFGQSDDSCFVIANVRGLNHLEFSLTPDLVLITNTGIGIIELKDLIGKIECVEPHQEWKHNGRLMYPFGQLRRYAQNICAQLLDKHERWLGLPTIFPQQYEICTAVCLTNSASELIVNGATLADGYSYRQRISDPPLKIIQDFRVLTAGGVPGWAISLALGVNIQNNKRWSTFKLSPEKIHEMTSEFFGASAWPEMKEIVMKTSVPRYGLMVQTSSGFSFVLNEPEVLIGRSRECQIPIPPEYKHVSRKHLRLLHIGNEVYIENMGKFGTLINGEPFQGRKLINDGDKIVLGISDQDMEVCEFQYHDADRLDLTDPT